MDVILGLCWGCKIPLPSGSGTRFQCELCQVASYCTGKCRYRDRVRHERECKLTIKEIWCATCFKKSRTLKRCKGCFITAYCSQDCQRLQWPDHKEVCKDFKKYMISLVAVKAVAPQLPDLTWYVGASMAEDYLRLEFNEGTTFTGILNLLFVGVGDVRDVIRTVSDLPSSFRGELRISLNDISPHIMARNLLFLYCGLARTEITYLAQIWYSFLLTPETYKYLKSVLRSLINHERVVVLHQMQNLVEVSEPHWQLCKKVWQGWYDLSKQSDMTKHMIQVRDEKMRFGVFRELTDMLLDTVPRCHLSSVSEFMKNGVFLPRDSFERTVATRFNSTMACFNPFNPKYADQYPDTNKEIIIWRKWDHLISPTEDMIYSVRPDAYVLNCWDYTEVVKAPGGKKDDVIIMYNEYVKQTFKKFFDNVKCFKIHFDVIVDDFKNLSRHLEPKLRFDRICTSNLADYYTFPPLLDQFGPLLNRENKHSVLITHHQNWVIHHDSKDTMGGQAEALRDLQIRSELLPGLSKIQQEDAIHQYVACRADYAGLSINLFHSFLINYSIYQMKICGKHPDEVLDTMHSPFEVAAKSGLHMRDFRIEPNRVVPFQREGNIRRVSMVHFNKRHVEWYHQ